jgi:hypothetical protein
MLYCSASVFSRRRSSMAWGYDPETLPTYAGADVTEKSFGRMASFRRRRPAGEVVVSPPAARLT